MTDPDQTSPATSRRRLETAIGVLVAAVVTVSLIALGVGALSGGSTQDMSASGGDSAERADSGLSGTADSARSADRDALTASADSAAQSAPSESAAEPAAVLLTDRAVIRTGAMSLITDDVEAARRELLAVTDQLGGYVGDEQSRADRSGRLRSAELTLQVPTDDLDTAMERIGNVGTVVARSQSARDVTEEVVDVDSRVASAEAALRRVRLLLDRAVSLGDVVRLEQVLSSRQAELEALLAQQESLAARTSTATLRVDVSLPAEVTPTPVATEEATGFLAGLSRGWDALTTGYVVLATVAGAILPTAVVLALIALAVRLVVRRNRWSRGTARRRPA